MTRFPKWAGWVALGLSVTTWVTVSVLMGQPFHAGGFQLRFFDLRIYHLGALRLMHASALYGAPMLDNLGFTYPPFAALVLAPLAWFPLAVDEAAVTVLNLGLLVFILRRTLLLTGRSRLNLAVLAPARAWSLAAALAAAALWLEPVSVGLGYGQVDLLISALVLGDLSRPDRARTKGLGIGLAAAIKLTPLLFIPYLLFSRRGRAAWVAGATFAASIPLAFLAAPRDAATYWPGTFLDTSRIGSGAGVVNQSLHGLIARLTGEAHPGAGWELVTVAIALGGLALAVRASRRGDEAAGFSLTALSALLVSPISWVHHWTLAVPALVLLGHRAYSEHSRALVWVTGALALVGALYLPEIAEGAIGTSHGALSLLTDPYPLAALAVLGVCAGSVLRTRLPSPRSLPRLRIRVTLEPARVGRWA